MSCPRVFELCSSFLHPEEKRGRVEKGRRQFFDELRMGEGSLARGGLETAGEETHGPEGEGGVRPLGPVRPSVGVALDVLPRSVGARACATSVPLPRGRSLSRFLCRA